MPTRPGRLRLSVLGGSVFADFSVDYHGILALRTISFDGFGCYRLEGRTSRMSASESQLILESALCQLLDTEAVSDLLRRYLSANRDVLPHEALAEHDLL
jgi:hypothetical protein